MGNINQTVGIQSRSFPVSCANRTWTAWSTLWTSNPEFGSYKAMQDSVLPGFWKLKKSGAWLPVLPLWSVIASYELLGNTDFISVTAAPICTPPTNSQAQYTGAYFASYVQVYGWGQHIATPVEQSAPNLVSEAITRCMADRQKGLSNYVESLAELDKTWAMLKSPLENVSKFAVAFQRASSYKKLQKLRKRAGLLKHQDTLTAVKARTAIGQAYLALVASEWLRFRYGISPLISDIKAAVKVASGTYDAPAIPHTSRASVKHSDMAKASGSVINGPYEYYYVKTTRTSISVRANWTDIYRSTPFDKLGLTFHNVVGVGWELTRLSFVVDWFVNVGDLIYANIPRVNVTPKGGSYTIVVDNDTVVSPAGMRPVNPALTYNIGSVSDSVRRRTVKKRRDVNTGRTELVIKSDFRLDNWIRASDAISLVISRLGQIRI